MANPYHIADQYTTTIPYPPTSSTSQYSDPSHSAAGPSYQSQPLSASYHDHQPYLNGSAQHQNLVTEHHGSVLPQLRSDGKEYVAPYQYHDQPSFSSFPVQPYQQPQPSHQHPSYQPSLPNPAPPARSQSQPIPGIEPLPPPTPKVAYDAPVFQTFQVKKRAKELAMMTQAGSSSINPTPPSPASNQVAPPVPSRSVPMAPQFNPLAMMGQSQPLGSVPPVPPPRSRSPSLPPSPLPSRSPSLPYSFNTSSRTPGNGPVPSRSPSIPNLNTLPPMPIVNPLRPLPSPSTAPTTPRASDILPSNSVPSSPHVNIHHPPHSAFSPIQATLERSDTVSSVKSLDRFGFSSSGGRPLPKPPVGVNSSKSLDRGIVPASSEPLRRGYNRRQPSTVSEEGSEEGIINGISKMDLHGPGSSSSASPFSGSTAPLPQVPIVVEPEKPRSQIVDPRTPAKFTPLPAFTLNDDSSGSSVVSTDDEDDSNDVTPRAKFNGISRSIGIVPPRRVQSPGIVITGLPTIAVSSTEPSDTAGEISFSVPTFSFDSEPDQGSSMSTAPKINTPSLSASVQRIQPNGAIICAGCQQPIIGRIVSAMKQRWHPSCFMCAECGELLEHVSSYEWEGKAYCHLDYHDKFANRCHHCKTPIVDSRFVTLEDPVLGQRFYHELHFFCSECGDPFLDPSKSSAPGTERSRKANGSGDGDDDEGETNDFVIHKGHPYCERCHLRLHKPKCKACSKPIPDIAVNAMGAKWHKECFVCSNCGNEFANNLFFPKEGKAFCTTCYEESISKRS